jgi:hypothetical protein
MRPGKSPTCAANARVSVACPYSGPPTAKSRTYGPTSGMLPAMFVATVVAQ